MAYSIAIDGPAGAGKSTIAKRVAKELGFIYVDTGAMYRAMAIYFVDNGIDGRDEAAVSKACADVDVRITYEDGAQQVILNGENVTGRLRQEEVGAMASAVAVYAAVRSFKDSLQRERTSLWTAGISEPVYFLLQQPRYTLRRVLRRGRREDMTSFYRRARSRILKL